MSSIQREQFLDVAMDIVAANGFDRLTLDRVARAAGATRAEVCDQFDDLAGLIAALVDREAHNAMALLSQGIAELPKDADIVQAEIGIVRAMIAAAAIAPASWRILLNPAVGDPSELHHRTAAGRALAREHVHKILVERLPENFADSHLTAHLHQMAGEELVRLHLNDPVLYPVDRILRQVEVLAQSLRTPESTGSRTSP
jgi:AcrR family transcriptional regulator